MGPVGGQGQCHLSPSPAEQPTASQTPRGITNPSRGALCAKRPNSQVRSVLNLDICPLARTASAARAQGRGRTRGSSASPQPAWPQMVSERGQRPDCQPAGSGSNSGKSPKQVSSFRKRAAEPGAWRPLQVMGARARRERRARAQRVERFPGPGESA